MKKKYFTPQTTAATIRPAKMIALSGEINTSKSITNSDDFGSRRGRAWDDDDEED